ncbi:hypothetical protein, partial [Anaerotruncus rubiinfantis]|uniref:hypothetical protein n=1 Tax=Anaerotruncus rubiinfantis TaxID=1720200 RepID=UPI003D7B5301
NWSYKHRKVFVAPFYFTYEKSRRTENRISQPIRAHQEAQGDFANELERHERERTRRTGKAY